MTVAQARPDSVSWGITADRIVATVTLLVGIPSLLVWASHPYLWHRTLGVLVMMAILLMARRRPGLGLLLFWLGSFYLILAGGGTEPVLLIQVIAGGWLAYATTRFGTRRTVVASGVSIGVGAWMAAMVLSGAFWSGPGATVLFVLVCTYLGLPWLLGLRQRAKAQLQAQRERAEDAEIQRLYAIEARQQALEQEQRLTKVAADEAASARLARDVHDVVGHSLAVILMQAESAQYLTTTQDLHESMGNIATCARRSLGEIREVLHAARGEHPSVPTPPGGLGALLDSVRASGVDLEVTQLGQGRALPPDAETVAYRVLQEMLTNAIKHGEHGQPISVALTWADRLTMEVRNLDGGHTISRALHGAGISGMTARLNAVGGSFELTRHQSDAGEVVTASAWLPLRAN